MTCLQLKDDLQQQLDPEVDQLYLSSLYDLVPFHFTLQACSDDLDDLDKLHDHHHCDEDADDDGEQGTEGDGEGGVGSTLEGKCCSRPLCSGQVCVIVIIIIISIIVIIVNIMIITWCCPGMS